MKDVNYFIVQAAHSNQREFELDYADVISVFDFNETHLMTEDGKELIITWNELGDFKSYFVDRVVVTSQMGEGAYIKDKVDHVISLLKNLTYRGESVDGETMQYILNKVGMKDQMLRQLMFSAPRSYVEDLWDEIVEVEKSLD